MNMFRVWILWRHGHNTAEIARRIVEEECDVDKVLARCLDAVYTGRPMPFSKAKT
jgi:hypothetical protein